ncbi:MAG TPA: hypothetical protein VGG49_02440 [Steroidobacteraceae bacterium]|jgi:hypothetical protein
MSTRRLPPPPTRAELWFAIFLGWFAGFVHREMVEILIGAARALMRALR